jgi:hypothetical protein
LGQRLLGLKVVDATTGKHLPFRRALIRISVRSAISVLRLVIGGRRLEAQRRRQESVRERMTELQPRISELQDQYSDDPHGLSTALSTLYREHAVKPWQACLDPQATVPMLYSLAVYVPALWSPRRQALHDRLAHAVVIRVK